MTPPLSYQLPDQQDLEKYIKVGTENAYIDAKSATKWDNDRESAKLAKHIAAFANSRDGGVLVIGKREKEIK